MPHAAGSAAAAGAHPCHPHRLHEGLGILARYPDSGPIHEGPLCRRGGRVRIQGMDEQVDRTIRLPDGRLLGYREFGDPQGVPVFFFHGIPGSRCSAAPVGERAREHGVRIIGVDRPGMGLSTFKPRRTFLDWPADIAALAEELRLRRFSIVGVSGGAAYVAACALRMPHRIAQASIVSGMGPMETRGATRGMRGMTRRRRMEIALARRAPHLTMWLGRGTIRKDADPRLADVVAMMIEEMAPADRQLLVQPEIAEAVRCDFSEAFRQGSQGVIWDLILYARPWGFRLEDIPIDVHVWHGDEDVTVPIAFGQALATTIPRSRPRFFRGEGHMMAITYAEDLLRMAVAAHSDEIDDQQEESRAS